MNTEEKQAVQGAPMTEGTARQFVEWIKAQPDDREPTTMDGALAEFEAHHGITAQATQAEVTDAAIDAATRHIYHAGRPTSKEYRVGIARAILSLRPV